MSCKKHPKYKGIRAPRRSNCDDCWKTYSDNIEKGISDMATLQEKAMIVTLRTGGWSGRQIDREVSTKIEEEMGAAPNSGAYMKFLLPPEDLNPVEKIIARAKIWLYNNSYPWSNAGDAIIPVSKHLECQSKMQEFKAELETEADKLEQRYQKRINERQKELGKMFRRSDYPDSIKNRFKLEVSFSPIPDSGDWRVNLSEEEVKRLSKEIEDRNKTFLRDSNKTLTLRLRDVVKEFLTRMQDKDQNSKTKLHADSLLAKIVKVVDSMDEMNLAEDKELNNLSNEIREAVKDLDPDMIREDAVYRQIAQSVVGEKLSKVESKMGAIMSNDGETANG